MRTRALLILEGKRPVVKVTHCTFWSKRYERPRGGRGRNPACYNDDIFFPEIYSASREKRRDRGAVAFIAEETLFLTSTAIDEFSDYTYCAISRSFRETRDLLPTDLIIKLAYHFNGKATSCT